MKEEKRLKIKLKEEENEIIHLKSKLKSETNNVIFEKLIICKENSLLHLPNKKYIDNKTNKRHISYKNILEESNNKDNKILKEKIEIINKNNSNYSSKNKKSKTNLLSNENNGNINKNKNNKYQLSNINMSKMKNNISHVIDYIHLPNDYYSPSNYNKIDSTFFKQENQEISKKSSPTSQNKLFSTINNNNCNRNNSQVMINVNTNIINSNGPIEKFKLYKKIKDYHRIFERKINEITRNIIPKSIKRTLAAFQNRRHSSPNFYDYHRQNQYSNINNQINKNSNSNIKKKKTSTPKKNKDINSSTKNYSNISINSNGKKTINNFRKKTPHRIVRQRKEISPNLKMNHYLYSSSNSNTKLQSKDNLKNNKNKNNNYIRIMKKNNISNNNTSKISSNNVSNFNSNNLFKNHIQIQNLLNNLGSNDFNNFKKLNHNNIFDGIINNNLIIGNIKKLIIKIIKNFILIFYKRN